MSALAFFAEKVISSKVPPQGRIISKVVLPAVTLTKVTPKVVLAQVGVQMIVVQIPLITEMT